jgi:hypothetical protein
MSDVEVIRKAATLLMYGSDRPTTADRYRMPAFDAVVQALAQAIEYGRKPPEQP